MTTAENPKDARMEQELLAAEKNAEELHKYFQDRKQGYKVRHGWSGVFDHQVFRLEKGKQKHVLEISRQVLTDSRSDEIIERLRKENWEHALESHPSHIASFSSQGLTFRLVAYA